MNRERFRAFLGVWMPMILGAAVVLVAGNFLLRTTEEPVDWPRDLSWNAMRSACAGGLVFVAIVLFISTMGRYRKTRAARAGDGKPPADPPPPTRPPEEGS